MCPHPCALAGAVWSDGGNGAGGVVRQATLEARKAKIAAQQAERQARRRVHQYPLRLNAAERAALETAAAAQRMTPANFLRAAFLAPAKGSGSGVPAGMPPAAGLDPAALAQLTRIGSNLNQLARRANSGDLLQPGELPETLRYLDTVLARIETLVFAHID